MIQTLSYGWTPYSGTDGVDPLQVSVGLTLLLFQTGLDITSILSAKKKLEAKRKRHEKKEAKRAKKAAKKDPESVMT